MNLNGIRKQCTIGIKTKLNVLKIIDFKIDSLLFTQVNVYLHNTEWHNILF